MKIRLWFAVGQLSLNIYVSWVNFMSLFLKWDEMGIFFWNTQSCKFFEKEGRTTYISFAASHHFPVSFRLHAGFTIGSELLTEVSAFCGFNYALHIWQHIYTRSRITLHTLIIYICKCMITTRTTTYIYIYTRTYIIYLQRSNSVDDLERGHWRELGRCQQFQASLEARKGMMSIYISPHLEKTACCNILKQKPTPFCRAPGDSYKMCRSSITMCPITIKFMLPMSWALSPTSCARKGGKISMGQQQPMALARTDVWAGSPWARCHGSRPLWRLGSRDVAWCE